MTTINSAPARPIANRPETDASAWTTPLVLAFVALLGVFPLVQHRLAWIALTGASLALTYASARARSVPALHLGVLCSLLLVALSAFGSMLYWPVAPILATVAYLIIAKRSAALGGLPERWFRRGKLDGATWRLIAASLAVSATALVVWFSLAKPDYSQVLGMFPKLPTYALFAGVVVFAMLNAALEETIYRGVVMGALDAALGVGAAPVILQAVVFGIVHIGGFPRGAIGIGLATIYGLMMGAVRRRAAGMLAPWIAHVGTDVAIGTILLFTLNP